MPPRTRSRSRHETSQEQPLDISELNSSAGDDATLEKETIDEEPGKTEGQRKRQKRHDDHNEEEQEELDAREVSHMLASTSDGASQRTIDASSNSNGRGMELDADKGTGRPVDNHEEHYDRIQKHPQWDRWEVLIPKYSVHRMKNKKAFVKFGAKYPTAESAARAADKALISILGRGDAEEHLNFPLSNYDPNGYFQRYGVDLSHYLVSLVQQGKQMVQTVAKSKHSRHTEVSSLHFRRIAQQKQFAEERKRMYDKNPLYKFHTIPCGVCPACKQPWSGMACVRSLTGRELGYRTREHAQMSIEGLESMAYRKAYRYAKSKNEKDIATAIMKELEGKYPVPELEPRSKDKVVPSAVQEDTPDHDEVKEETTYDRNPGDFQWMIPFPTIKKRDFIKKRTEAGHRQMNLRLRSVMAKEAKAVRDEILEDDSFVKYEYPIRERQRDDGGYYNMLKSIDTARREGSDILFAQERSPIWMRPSTFKSQQCPYCRGWHAPNLKLCPFMQATAAIMMAERPMCNKCKDSGCSFCTKGSLPAWVWTPEFTRVGWVDDVSPEMLNLMLSIQHIGNAAISDLKSPLIAGKLTPNALLAMAVMAEVMIDDSLKQEKEKRR
ncbi:hypothetical protein PSENEW3n2_00002129 [Picochlorum sp. SENEW3]|nr:hypothetical protein PSENEW3n2_00002129 [Picochlorum sp. SENEW3]WPT14899.1 hypothetical protein PSENEW3_00002129 [Picochlorum sp. SENEW3]